MEHHQPRRPKQKQENPISAALASWLRSGRDELPLVLPPQQHADLESDLLATSPKRWVVYEPMVLLPSGSFTGPRWRQVRSPVDAARINRLWAGILAEISSRQGGHLTHLAVNEGIPLHVPVRGEDEGQDRAVAETAVGVSAARPAAAADNILRSPSGLNMLYGGFGPDRTLSSTGLAGEADFERGFWVSTRQNGISQVWAPRWTMFSRGNVKEKARLLEFHQGRGGGDNALAHRVLPRGGGGLEGRWAVDLYAGIGYFVFSYVRLGLRVLCWELNPWSVEGLRRGALANGWTVRVFRGTELRGDGDDDDLSAQVAEAVASCQERIIVFQEDNGRARERIRELRSRGVRLPVVHVNCGLLPRSDDSWDTAWDIVGGPTAQEEVEGGREDGDGAWLHLHENVGVRDIEDRRKAIQSLFEGWGGRTRGSSGALRRCARVEHVELVKTFAPDVWHCVFDVYITGSDSDVT